MGGWGAVLRGWAVVRKGLGEEGIQEIHQGLEAWRAAGAQVAQPWMLTLLSDSYRRLGRTGEGLSVVAEALAAVEMTGERQYEAELYRLKGELLLPSWRVSRNQDESATPEAESCFLEAIEIARRQQAKSLELRSSTSLSRLWQQRGKKQQARRLLAEIYGWFTEGFDTSDLKQAKALLEDLD